MLVKSEAFLLRMEIIFNNDKQTAHLVINTDLYEVISSHVEVKRLYKNTS